MNCPVCNRVLSANIDEHHLIPKCKKGSETVTLHRVCHTKIHSVFTETALAKYYNTIPRIMENDDMIKFAKWVRKQPLDFIGTNIMSNKRNPRKNK